MPARLEGTLIASSVGFAGVCITAGSALARTDMQGNATALAMTFCFAATVVLARRWPHLNLPWVTGLTAGLCAVLCVPLASRTIILSAQAGLIALLNVVLSPVLVFWAFHEVPSRAAIIGGGFILTALLWHLSVQLRQETLGGHGGTT